MSAPIATDLDYHNDGPQTVFEGRRWSVEIEFYTPVDCTPAQVEEAVAYILGGGSIAADHPLIDEDFRDVVANCARRDRVRRYTDWGAKDESGSRQGRGRVEYDA